MYYDRGTSPKRSHLVPTRQSLLSRLKNWDDRESWNAFFDTYWKLIYYTAQKAGLTEAECQDVVQETVIYVCRKMPQFKYDSKTGSFKAWLLNLTQWRIRDQVRKRLPREERKITTEDGETDLLDSIPDPQTTWDVEWEKNLFDAATERVKRKIDPKLFQIFDLYVLQNWRPEKVRKLLNISSTQVYVAKHRVLSLLKKEMRHLETHFF
jgi:RNA polymerase sigma factor (sigma-70 family)